MEDEAAANFLVNFANVLAGSIVEETSHEQENELHQFDRDNNMLQGQQASQVEDSLQCIQYSSSNVENNNPNTTENLQLEHSNLHQQGTHFQGSPKNGDNSVNSMLANHGAETQGPQIVEILEIEDATHDHHFDNNINSPAVRTGNNKICDNQRKSDVFQCATCSLTFDTNEQLENHRSESHPIVDSGNETTVLSAAGNQDIVTTNEQNLPQDGSDILTALVMEESQNGHLQPVAEENTASDVGNTAVVVETENGARNEQSVGERQEEPSAECDENPQEVS